MGEVDMDEIGWDSYIDKIIRDAMEDGAFDDLRGEGQPLPKEEENPFVPGDRRLANHLLKSNGFTLPWIAKRHEVLAQRERLAQPLLRTWRLYEARVSFRPEDPLAHDLWARAQERFREAVCELNRQIEGYNLMVPSDALRLLPLDAERELARLLAQNEAK
jgi:hypothetical protein